MKMLTSIEEIPELCKENVHIRDKENLLKNINKIITDGFKKLQIVTDFDHTLTRHDVDGEPVLTSFGMFRECPSIPQKYKDDEINLSNYYKPIEVDASMGLEDKINHMKDWYLASHNLMKGLKFPRNELIEISKKMVGCFRKGVNDLITWSQAHEVPVLVFSAGLGECVVAALNSADFLLPNVKVISNFLALDENDNIVGIKGEVIHTYNKNETAIKHTEYYEMVKKRDNVLLMGDNIGDAGMAEGMEHCDVVIKIGFLGRNTQANLPNYVSAFDIVVVNEHTMDIANAILKLML